MLTGREYDIAKVQVKHVNVDDVYHYATTVTMSFGATLNEWTHEEVSQRDDNVNDTNANNNNDN